MDVPLKSLFHAIAQAQAEADLKGPIMEKVGQYFDAKRWGLSFLTDFPAVDSNTPVMIRRALSLDYNPVLRYLVQRHTAVHDEVILPPGVWRTICPRADHAHVMVGPIISEGQLVGGVAVTRDRQSPAFSAENLADLSALCLHFSTRLATLRSQSFVSAPAAIAPAVANRLTPREAEIVERVAQGLTNKQIGTELWITENSVKQALKRIFRKLEVSSRAEMVAKLSAYPATNIAKPE